MRVRKNQTNKVLLDVDASASDKLPLALRQSSKGGRYSPSPGIEESGK
jgi:hypothetical protein